MLPLVALLLAGAAAAAGRVINFETDVGGVPGDASLAASNRNAALVSGTMQHMVAGDTLLIPPGRFYMNGNVTARDRVGLTLQIDGSIVVHASQKDWPRHGPKKDAQVWEFMQFFNMTDFTVRSSNTNTGMRGETAGSSGRGLIDGNGAAWWGVPGVGYLEIGENRPRLMYMDRCRNVLVENLFFKDSPYWTVYIHDVDGLEIRNSKVEAYRVSGTEHTTVDLTAFNTDGFDFTGNNIWVHHSTVWNQDDCFDIKDSTTNVIVEHVEASGLGLTIGSIASNVRNITFRNAHMKSTVKGIYMKFRGDGIVEDVLYENIVIDEPSQYPIWIGPAQQVESSVCSLLWPADPFASCELPDGALYRNIVFRNIVINNPKGSAGVIIGSASRPIEGVIFEDVVINNPTSAGQRWGPGYYCKNVNGGVAVGGTTPIPDCFTKA